MLNVTTQSSILDSPKQQPSSDAKMVPKFTITKMDSMDDSNTSQKESPTGSLSKFK